MPIEPSALFINLSGLEKEEAIKDIQRVFNEVINEYIEQNKQITSC
jgi:hypothetical protein